MGIEGLELAVQVDLLINGVFELGDAGADVLVLAGPKHMELVRLAEIVQRDPSAVEGFFGDLLAVELAAVDRGAKKSMNELAPGSGQRKWIVASQVNVSLSRLMSSEMSYSGVWIS